MFMSYELYNFYKHVSFGQLNLLARSRTHIYFVLSLLLSFFMCPSLSPRTELDTDMDMRVG